MNQISFSTPFYLNKDKENGDPSLLKYLQDKSHFSFISEDSWDLIDKLKLDNDDKDDFRFLHDKLLNLWPLILTDALQELKRHDQEEYDSAVPNMDNFFDPASLGSTELKEVLEGFSEFEGMMYGASPSNYRDHIAHSFRVWIIGHGILKECFKEKLSLRVKNEFNDTINAENNELQCMWAMIALCHDIGYPLSHIERINQKARDTLKKQGLMHEGDLRFSFSSQLQPFHNTIIQLMSSDPVQFKNGGAEFFTHLRNKYYLKYLKSYDKLNHGIISCLLMSKALVYFLESDFSHDSRKALGHRDIKQFVIRREILRAIADHTCPDIYHLTFNNLSILLYFVDEIQCWGRPTLEESQHEASNIEEGFATIDKFEENKINITITTKDEMWDVKQQKGVLHQILKIRKMLRLAFETPKHLDRELCFKVCNKSKQYLSIEFKDKNLQLFHHKFSVEEVFGSVLKLKKQIEEKPLS
ncbi:MAG: hypothetical protein DRP56_01750 [Planctomycetota bacterium]|nr:MAG: hypothetical protein DRP56_01750 [Planctomycetota bacterium]